jgi:hypothetical protein
MAGVPLTKPREGMQWWPNRWANGSAAWMWALFWRRRKRPPQDPLEASELIGQLEISYPVPGYWTCGAKAKRQKGK